MPRENGTPLSWVRGHPANADEAPPRRLGVLFELRGRHLIGAVTGRCQRSMSMSFVSFERMRAMSVRTPIADR